ncbi:hypothetical protein L6V77_16760 [Myxococcota bacterium]|nr:hypothetical protein [Myxococcota bacterium]
MIEHPVEAAVPLDANGDGLVDLLVSVSGGPPFVLLRGAGGPPPGGSR